MNDLYFKAQGTTSQFTGGTVSGATEFTGGLTANTLNVNGINITGDTYVTGGTYSAGTIDFNYNSGGGFQVLNLYTGETVTISGGTNIQITGSYPSFGVNFTGTTGVDELSELQDVLISGTSNNDRLVYNSTLLVWENKPVASGTTGTVISFDSSKIYNTRTSPATGNITGNYTDARIGIVQKIYHNHSVAPTFPGTWVRLGSGTYTISTLNVIYVEWTGTDVAEYWIVKGV